MEEQKFHTLIMIFVRGDDIRRSYNVILRSLQERKVKLINESMLIVSSSVG